MKRLFIMVCAWRNKMSRTKKGPVYLAQEEACRQFFNTKYPIRETEKPDELEYRDGEDGKVYDITGLCAIKVIATIIAIINDPKWPTETSMVKKTFYFLVKSKNNDKEPYRMFKLRANPTKNQPGNGAVSIMYLEGKKRPKGNKRKQYQSRQPKAYSTLIKDLFQANTSPKNFAKVIQKLFKDNSEIVQQDTAIAEMYFLLLFEIARRGSSKEYKTDEGKRLDKLPIGSAIVKIIKLLGATDKNEDSEYLKKKLECYCYCFKTRASARERAIMKLNDETRSKLLRISVDLCVKELEEMYCKSKVNAAVEPFRLYYWMKSFNRLEEFVERRIQVMGRWSRKRDGERTFKGEDGKVLMNCKYDKAKKRWTLNFTNLAKCTAFKNKFLKIVAEDDSGCLQNGKDLQFRGRKFRVHNVKGDGACFFRAVSHQIFRTEKRHHEIRMAGINYIRRNLSEFADFLTEPVKTYIRRMSNDAEWCDDIIMKAVAEAKNVAIRVIKSGSSRETVFGQDGQDLPEIYVGYNNIDHYVSLEPLT